MAFVIWKPSKQSLLLFPVLEDFKAIVVVVSGYGGFQGNRCCRFRFGGFQGNSFRRFRFWRLSSQSMLSFPVMEAFKAIDFVVSGFGGFQGNRCCHFLFWRPSRQSLLSFPVWYAFKSIDVVVSGFGDLQGDRCFKVIAVVVSCFGGLEGYRFCRFRFCRSARQSLLSFQVLNLSKQAFSSF